MATPADLALAPVAVQRSGYDAAGAVVAVNDTLLTTKRVRQPYPNQATLTAADVALSDVVLAGDVIAGVTNNSTLASPKPIANWAMLARALVGNSLTLEVTGNHLFARGGRPFACVVFSVSDGTTTVTATASALTVSGHVGDRNAVQVFAATLDISALATGVITANAKVYPWVGGPASVLDSAASSVEREFSPRRFYKDAARFAAPPLAYVASTGSDAGGVVSTNAATASATPFLTVQGAIDGLLTASGVSGGYLDGCRIRVKDGVNLGASAAVAKAQRCAALVIERDPNVTKAAAVVTMANTWRPRLGVGTLQGGLTEGAVLLRDLSFSRGGLFTFQGEAANQLNVQFADDVLFANNGNNAALIANAHLRIDGMTITGHAAALFNAGTYEVRMLRGVRIDAMANAAWEGWLTLGCTLTAPGNFTQGTRTASGAIVQFNQFLKLAHTSAVFDIGGSTSETGVSFSGNLIEVIHTTTSTPALRLSSDSGTGSLTHVLADNNSIVGHYQAGRCNLFYDENTTTGRSHTLCRVRNSIVSAYYNKGDVFVTNSARVGNWSELHAVSGPANWALWVNPGVSSIGATEGQAYAGVGASWASSNVTMNDPLFVNNQATKTNGTTSAAVAGAGGGDYSLQAGSGAIGMVSAAGEVFSFGLAGGARDRGAVGAYR